MFTTFISALLMGIVWVHRRHLHYIVSSEDYGYTKLLYMLKKTTNATRIITMPTNGKGFSGKKIVNMNIDRDCLLTTPKVKIGWVDRPLCVYANSFSFWTRKRTKVYVMCYCLTFHKCLSSHWRSFYFFLCSRVCAFEQRNVLFLLVFFYRRKTTTIS